MEIEELRTLGETTIPKSVSFDYVICRHGKTIGERRSDTGEPSSPRQCVQCIVEMEILERMERIELFLRKECSCRHPEYPCLIHDHPDGTPKKPGE